MSYPNPSNLQIRVGFETTEGLGDSASLIDMRVRSESVGGNFPLIQNEDIIASAETPEGLPTKIDPSGDFNVTWNAEDHAKLLAQFSGHGKNPVTLTSGAYRHRYAPRETDIAFRTLQAEISRDNGRPTVYPGCYVSAVDWSVSPGGLMLGKASLVIPRFHFWKAPAISVGTPALDNSYLRGIANYANLDADLYMKIAVAPSGGSMGVQFKVGSGGTYGSTITVAAGAWYDVLEGASDAQVGSDELPVQVYFANLTGFALNDVVLYGALRSVWTQSLAVSSPSNEISGALYIDGSTTPTRVRDFSVAASRPAVRDEIIGGRFTDVILEHGKRASSITIKRRSIDRSLANRLLHAKFLTARFDIVGTQIGATSYRRKLSAITMNAIPSGKESSVGGPTQFDDDITFTCHPSSDSTYPSAMTFEAVNAQSATQ